MCSYARHIFKSLQWFDHSRLVINFQSVPWRTSCSLVWHDAAQTPTWHSSQICQRAVVKGSRVTDWLTDVCWLPGKVQDTKTYKFQQWPLLSITLQSQGEGFVNFCSSIHWGMLQYSDSCNQTSQEVQKAILTSHIINSSNGI